MEDSKTEKEVVMKAIRWIVGFFWVWIFTFIVDFIFFNYVFQNILGNSGLARQSDQLRTLMPLMLIGEFILAVFFTYYFFKIYKEAGLLVLRGLFFGFWIGFFVFGWRAVWAYYLFSFQNSLVWWMLILGWVECIIAGLGIGVIGWVIPNLFKSAIKNAQTEVAAEAASAPKEPPAPEKVEEAPEAEAAVPAEGDKE